MVWLTDVNQFKRRELEQVKPADALEPKMVSGQVQGLTRPLPQMLYRRCRIGT